MTQCPQLLDAIGRPLQVGSYCFYRAGGGRLRLGKITKINLKDLSNSNYNQWQLKLSIKAVEAAEMTYSHPSGSTSSMEVASWCFSTQAGPGTHWHQQPPGPTAQWRTGFKLGDPEILQELQKIIP